MIIDRLSGIRKSFQTLLLLVNNHDDDVGKILYDSTLSCPTVHLLIN
jgi:hypothetical protein